MQHLVLPQMPRVLSLYGNGMRKRVLLRAQRHATETSQQTRPKGLRRTTAPVQKLSGMQLLETFRSLSFSGYFASDTFIHFATQPEHSIPRHIVG